MGRGPSSDRGALMGKPVESHPEAVEEARAAREWYAERSPQAAEAFVAELDRAIEKIAEAPGRWPTHLHGTRRVLLRRFPFLVVYRERKDVVQVIAVAHGRRRPGYWRGR
ncbi:MAG: type II toxin-antitoxin system RelE/ParE family toxin [Planctomycetes bacterium]|nr:type II toxin-antitoxin system RelE/ParE family toxin [Planctomycetota bacterium]